MKLDPKICKRLAASSRIKSIVIASNRDGRERGFGICRRKHQKPNLSLLKKINELKGKVSAKEWEELYNDALGESFTSTYKGDESGITADLFEPCKFPYEEQKIADVHTHPSGIHNFSANDLLHANRTQLEYTCLVVAKGKKRIRCVKPPTNKVAREFALLQSYMYDSTKSFLKAHKFEQKLTKDACESKLGK